MKKLERIVLSALFAAGLGLGISNNAYGYTNDPGVREYNMKKAQEREAKEEAKAVERREAERKEIELEGRKEAAREDARSQVRQSERMLEMHGWSSDEEQKIKEPKFNSLCDKAEYLIKKKRYDEAHESILKYLQKFKKGNVPKSKWRRILDVERAYVDMCVERNQNCWSGREAKVADNLLEYGVLDWDVYAMQAIMTLDAKERKLYFNTAIKFDKKKAKDYLLKNFAEEEIKSEIRKL